MTDNVKSLGAARADAAGDNRLWKPVECLEEAIRDLRSGEMKADKLIVLFISTDEQQFNVSNYSANIKASEVLAAVECMKAKLLVEMGYY